MMRTNCPAPDQEICTLEMARNCASCRREIEMHIRRGHVVGEDEYGIYFTPTLASYAYARHKLDQFGRVNRALVEKENTLRFKLSKLREKHHLAVVRYERKLGSRIGDGRDYKNIAPGTYKAADLADRRLVTAMRRRDRIWRWRCGDFNLSFAVELCKLGE